MLRAVGEEAGSSAPDLDRHAWADLPRAVGAGPLAVAEAVERAEGELLAELHAAGDDPAVSGPVRDAVARACDGAKAGHDRALQRLKRVGG